MAFSVQPSQANLLFYHQATNVEAGYTIKRILVSAPPWCYQASIDPDLANGGREQLKFGCQREAPPHDGPADTYSSLRVSPRIGFPFTFHVIVSVGNNEITLPVQIYPSSYHSSNQPITIQKNGPWELNVSYSPPGQVFQRLNIPVPAPKQPETEEMDISEQIEDIEGDIEALMILANNEVDLATIQGYLKTIAELRDRLAALKKITGQSQELEI